MKPIKVIIKERGEVINEGWWIDTVHSYDNGPSSALIIQSGGTPMYYELGYIHADMDQFEVAK